MRNKRVSLLCKGAVLEQGCWRLGQSSILDFSDLSVKRVIWPFLLLPSPPTPTAPPTSPPTLLSILQKFHYDSKDFELRVINVVGTRSNNSVCLLANLYHHYPRWYEFASYVAAALSSD